MVWFITIILASVSIISAIVILREDPCIINRYVRRVFCENLMECADLCGVGSVKGLSDVAFLSVQVLSGYAQYFQYAQIYREHAFAFIYAYCHPVHNFLISRRSKLINNTFKYSTKISVTILLCSSSKHTQKYHTYAC
jgi:hypothetical protein